MKRRLYSAYDGSTPPIMNIKLKVISCLLIMLPMACLGEAKKKQLPAGKEQLAKWIVGTEWKNKQIHKGKWIYVVRRFYPNNVMKYQWGVRKWTAGTFISKHSYSVTSGTSIQYGGDKWSAVFNEDFSEYTSNSKKRKARGKGTYLRTFKD
jgi:hypothetical protein